MGLVEKIFVVVNLILAVGLCAAVGSSYSTVKAAKEETLNVREKLSDEEQLRENLDAKVGAAESSFNELSTKLAKASGELDTARETIERLRQDIQTEKEQLNLEIRNRDASNAELKGQVNNLRQDNEVNLARFAKEKSVWTSDNAALVSAKEYLIHQLDTATKNHTNSITEVIEQRDELERKYLVLKGSDTSNQEKIEKIDGRVTNVEPDRIGGGVIVSITTTEGSKKAYVGTNFHVFRTTEGIYLGMAIVDQVFENKGNGSQVLIAIVQNIVSEASIEINDEASTIISGE